MAGRPIVTFDDVSKTFPNGTLALSGLRLEINKGEFLSILGPSGCGKSTALRILAGLTPPSHGKVVWNDPATDDTGDIGFVFQEPTLMPWATVAENVALPLKLKRKPSSEAVAQALSRVGLLAFRDVYPRELSGGMKMRVSIARALVTGPKLILMDEPFAALDEITRFKLNNDLLTLWRSLGGTVVFVTHSVFESVYLSNRVVVMTQRPGRIAAELLIDEAYPRAEAFRTSPDYAAHCRRASQALNDAMADA